MSLTSFIAIPEIKEHFTSTFPRPEINLDGAMTSPPHTNHYGLVGTAFDYMLRFYLEANTKKVITKGWVAEQAVQMTKQDPALSKKANKILEECSERYLSYQKTKKVGKEILEATLLLAQLDPIYRARYVDPNLGVIDKQDIEDLSSLISNVKPAMFKTKKICLLNPTFGAGSILVGGADADLIIDDTIIDIKTTKYLKVDREYFNQLMGYYILYKIGKLDKYPKGLKIDKVGIYFSRYGKLVIFKIDDITKNVDMSKFTKWFIREASKAFPVEIEGID